MAAIACLLYAFARSKEPNICSFHLQEMDVTDAGGITDQEDLVSTLWSLEQTTTEPPTYSKTPRLIVAATITCLTISCNVFTILLLRRSTGDSEKRQDVLFVQSLFTSDLVCGVTTMLMAVVSGMFPSGIATGSYFYKIQMFFWNWSACCSLYCMAAISFVKLLAITRPLLFEQDVTTRRCLLVIAGLWVFTFLISLPILTEYVEILYIDSQMLSVISFESQAYNLAVGFLVAFPASITIFLSYGKIFLVILKHKRTIVDVNQCECEQPTSLAVISTIRSAKRMVIIIGLYFVVYAPAFLALSSGIISNPDTRDEWYCFVSMWLMLSNTCINSIAYVTMYSETRAAARKMLLCSVDDIEDSFGTRESSRTGGT